MHMVEIILGNAVDVLRGMPEGRVRTCVTSPPYLWQRKYLPDDDARANIEIGREVDIKSYVSALVSVFEEVRRVLSADGTLWVNLGDGHANDTKWGGSTSGKHQPKLHGDPGTLRQKRSTGLPPKCLMGLPWRFALAMIDAGWTLRCDIIWDTNAMPEGNVRDRPTISHEYVFLFSKGASYFYGIDAIREPCTMAPQRRTRPHKQRAVPGQPTQTWGNTASRDVPGVDGHPKGRNARSVWYIPTDKGDGQHVAPMPKALARRCILAGSAHGDTVLDPFGGSGTVGIVAAEEGRGAILIDLDERSVALMRSRTSQLGLVATT